MFCQNYDQFTPNFDMACKSIQRVSVPNMKLFVPIKQSYGPKNLENFLLCNRGKWVGGHCFAHRHVCYNINAWRSSKRWSAVTLAFIARYINLKLAENFQNEVI